MIENNNIISKIMAKERKYIESIESENEIEMKERNNQKKEEEKKEEMINIMKI